MILIRLSRAFRWGSQRTGATGSLAMLCRIAALSRVGPLWKLQSGEAEKYYQEKEEEEEG